MKSIMTRPAPGRRAADAPLQAAPLPRVGFAQLGAGLLAGLLGGLAMTLLMALLRDRLGIASPGELIGDRVAALLPFQRLNMLIGLAGGYNQLKQFGVGSVALAQLAIGAAGGLLYAAIVARERRTDREETWGPGLSRRGVSTVALLIGLFWLASVALLWPVLRTNFRGLPQGEALAATVIGLLLSYALYGLVMLFAYRFMTIRSSLRGSVRGGAPIERRAFMVGGAALVVALGSGWLIRRLYQRAVFSYDGTQYQGSDLKPITPNERFYVVTKNVVDPNVGTGAWCLELNGHVQRPQSYAFDDLAALPSTTQETTLMCISNGLGAGLMSDAVWKGVSLRSLIESAQPKPGVVKVVLHGADEYTDTLPIEKAMDPTTFVAYEMNGAALPQRHGYPVRIIVPGLVGEKSVKWVTRIELIDHNEKGFYEKEHWGPDFVVPTRSRIDVPTANAMFKAGETAALKGIAFAGDRGVAGVEVSADNGTSWQPAALDYPGSRLSWALWSFAWKPAQPGEYMLVVRATDGTGVRQTAETRPSGPEAATGYHTVGVRVIA